MSKMKKEAEKSAPSVEYDTLIDAHSKWASAEQDAASDAGERRQQIGAFAEKHNVENKALSQIRAGLKIKNEGKRLDWLRSMEAMLPHAAQFIRGNATAEMDFEADSGEPADEVVPFDQAAE